MVRQVVSARSMCGFRFGERILLSSARDDLSRSCRVDCDGLHSDFSLRLQLANMIDHHVVKKDQ
jgi:hypothetical protein